jgi:hypothetical protein
MTRKDDGQMDEKWTESEGTTTLALLDVRMLLGTVTATALSMAGVIIWASGHGGASELLGMIVWPWVLAMMAWAIARLPRGQMNAHSGECGHPRRILRWVDAHER